MPVSFLVRAKSGYYLDEEINKMYAHQTGPPETGQTEVVRNVVVFGVRIPGKRTVSEEGHLDNSERNRKTASTPSSRKSQTSRMGY